MRIQYLSLTASPLAVAVALGVAVLLHLSSGSPASAGHQCANTGSLFGPFDIETYEAADYRDVYARTFELAAFNQLFPEHETFATADVETGDRAAGSEQLLDPYIPPVILKSMGFLESGWAQAAYVPLVDYGEVGPVLNSHDCGYGIMQITSGMQNISGVPNLDQAMIGTHYAFNTARGAAILAGKWNQAPEVRPIVGERDPTLIEDWYYAIWGYNGWAFSNHPLNPAYPPTRVQYSCGASDDGFGHDRTQYPYQELVLGCAQRPPVRAEEQLWQPQEVHLPDLTDPIFADPLKLENWNACGFSLDCAAMDIPRPNTNHEDPTALTVTREEVIGEPVMGLATAGAGVTLPPDVISSGPEFDVLNEGSGVLGFQVLSDSPWLKVAKPAGVALGEDLGGIGGTVRLTVDTTGPGAGRVPRPGDGGLPLPGRLAANVRRLPRRRRKRADAIWHSDRDSPGAYSDSNANARTDAHAHTNPDTFANPDTAGRDLGGRQLLGLRRSHRRAGDDAPRRGAADVHCRLSRYELDGEDRGRVAAHLGRRRLQRRGEPDRRAQGPGFRRRNDALPGSRLSGHGGRRS